MISGICSFFLLLLCCGPATTPARPVTYHTVPQPVSLLAAGKQIKKLENGVLLVRLQSRWRTVVAAREQGRNGYAQEISQAQHRKNLQIVKAFKDKYRFCPVYFFYSHYSDAIAQGRFDEVVFVNEQLQPDSTIAWPDRPFLTAEFGHLSHTLPQTDDTGRHYAQSDGNNVQPSALVLMDEQFRQLRRPFPFYVRTYESSFRRDPQVVVSKLHTKLSTFSTRFVQTPARQPAQR